LQEEVKDLLRLAPAEEPQAQQPQPALSIREEAGGGVMVSGLSVHDVDSLDAVSALLYRGALCRSTASTNMNMHSSRWVSSGGRDTGALNKFTFVAPSHRGAHADCVLGSVAGRSHAVCTLYLEGQCADKMVLSKFNLVDLAGSGEPQAGQCQLPPLKLLGLGLGPPFILSCAFILLSDVHSPLQSVPSVPGRRASGSRRASPSTGASWRSATSSLRSQTLHAVATPATYPTGAED
jgi:hypothetical protein